MRACEKGLRKTGYRPYYVSWPIAGGAPVLGALSQSTAVRWQDRYYRHMPHTHLQRADGRILGRYLAGEAGDGLVQVRHHVLRLPLAARALAFKHCDLL